MLIVDSFLPEYFAEGIQNHILFNCKHSYGHSSVGGNRFYTVEFDTKDPIILKVFNYLKKHTSFSVKRAYANIQYIGMDGEWHYDDGDQTALIFLNRDIEGGNLQLNNATTNIEPLFNRLVLFRGSTTKHRGLSPSNPGVPRISLAFKLWNKIYS